MSNKRQSLHSTTEAAIVPTTIRMPAIFGAPPPKIAGKAWAPYMAFAHPKRVDEWKKIQGKFGTNVEEGELYFIHNDEVRRQDSYKLTMLCCKQFWASKNPVGKILAVSYEEKPDPFREHIEAVVLVWFDDGIVPANIQFRTTKCPMGKALADALAEVTTPEWFEQSDAHKETMKITQPFYRYYGECSVAPERPSKTSGMPYKPGVCVVKPTMANEWVLAHKFDTGEDTQRLLNLCESNYLSRLKEHEPLLVK